MKYFAHILFFLSLSLASHGQSIFDQTDALLKKYVSNGAVSYSEINQAEFADLIKKYKSFDLSTKNKNFKSAFYINAYNLNVIQKITEKPTTSVIKRSGFFDKDQITVAGETMTLNQLEKEKLLKVTKDPRLHFVLVCGAKGCPPIEPFAYRPQQLENQLEGQTKKALNDDAFIRTKGQTEISQIFQWYMDDFGGSESSILEYINSYRDSKLSGAIKYYEYDWSPNGK